MHLTLHDIAIPPPATVRGFPILGAYYLRTVRACALIGSSEIIGPAGCHHSRRWRVAASAPSCQEPDVPQASDRTLEVCAPLNYSNPITIKADLSTHGTAAKRCRFTSHIPERVNARPGRPKSDQQIDPCGTVHSPLLLLRIQSPAGRRGQARAVDRPQSAPSAPRHALAASAAPINIILASVAALISHVGEYMRSEAEQ